MLFFLLLLITDQDEPLKDDMPCQKCNKSDQPEWILLCDTCNQGWHASCLRPALMIIPDGDWYCPHCRHVSIFKHFYFFNLCSL